ncbi:uncharacterized protein MYCFIDRAFT_34609 [Pseudocercospora fijiensis CIRAD86]|uniref:Enoyl reductase (ER) domain-containing protein n=1 Tax=Pseudocercospora fijiensis (strain CIRAD86) TaxID=383855 RepID=M2YNQ9_PSEFD|nr:uncharacterized protein MYCFIDRAFT_34609 [Pseudocercospora fijiensis CIRAD86]EME79360.1 hypothetical protein MYCFIDRAFT_34609 [Pseudocercospora fijiensis CIRAD86]
MASSTTNGSNSVPATQKAAQFNPSDQSVSINEIPVPSIKPYEILVKVKAASLCHSDLMLFEENEQGLKLGSGEPFTMGHEGCGTIIEVGSEVGDNFKPGDRIGWLPIVDCCYDCEECQIHNLYCEKGTSKVQGMTVDGYFQEYAAINWRNAAHIPDGMDLANLAPLFCAGCTAFNSVTDTIAELKGIPEENWVAVVGCGGLGHLGIQYLKAFGYKVIGIDLSADAVEEALAQGADHVFNPMKCADYIDQVRQITGGKGCHAVINYTNSVPAYSNAVGLLRMNGVLMVTGIPQKPLQFSAMDVSMKRIRVRGSNNGTTPRLKKCVEFSYKHGIEPHVTQFKLEEFPKMVELMRSNRHKGRLGVLFQ